MHDATLLLTRPAVQSARFAAAARVRLGPLPVLVAPLIEIRPLPLATDPGAVDGVILASEPAVTALAAAWAGRPPAWCVGRRTATAAAAAGFPVAATAADARHLAPLVRGRRILDAHGRHQAFDFAAALASAGIETIPALIYDQVPLPLPAAARALLAAPAPVLLPLFSARSARLFRGAAGPATAAPLWIAAMSAPVAAAAAPGPRDHLAVAARPEAEAVLDVLARHLAALAAAAAGRVEGAPAPR